MTGAVFAELMIRAGAAGILLMMAIMHATRGTGFSIERIAALFEFGTAAYVVVSGPASWDLLGPVHPLFWVTATFNSVFFWWLATALFDDNFRWEPWRLAPAVFLLGTVIWRFQTGAPDPFWLTLVHQLLVVAMMLHAIWLALSHREEDLVEPRRRFRIVFAFAVGLLGLVIAVGELAFGQDPWGWLTLLHSVGLASFVLIFGLWILQPKDVFQVSAVEAAAERRSGPSLADQHELDKLQALMDAGAYRTEGLTVAGLAEKVGVPEHRLRRLINGSLGFRNFTAFLNARRIEEAKTLLSDPANARRQILQIALDLGYGSVGPFNRAFKDVVGQTPSEFRKQALGT